MVRTMSKFGMGFLFLFIVLCVNSGCRSQSHGSRMRFSAYPNLKLGFTTQCFIKCVPVTVEQEKKFIDYAAENGFHWIELRDPDAVLTIAQCREIGDYARSKHIEIGYANQRGLLDPDFWEVYSRGVKNAQVFTGTGTIRALISGKNFQDKNKLGLTREELEQTVAMANKAADLAQQNGLQLVIENGTEPLRGNGKTVFGLKDVFARVNKNVGWQFDTGNFFAGNREALTVSQVADFLKKNVHNLYYLHLKSIQDGQPQPALCQNVYDFNEIFSIIAKHNVNYLAIELDAIDKEQEIYQNLQKSLTFLRVKDLME